MGYIKWLIYWNFSIYNYLIFNYFKNFLSFFSYIHCIIQPHSFVKTFHTFIKYHTPPYYPQNNQNNNLYHYNKKSLIIENMKKWTFATCSNEKPLVNTSRFYHIKSLTCHTQNQKRNSILLFPKTFLHINK